MKQTKKGFTLVELLVVIAILAILATVSVVGYTTFFTKAHISNDTAIVRQMNIALQANEPLDGKNATAYDALQDILSAGFDIEKLTPTTEGYHIVWDQNSDRIALLREDHTVEFAEGTLSAPVHLWKFVDYTDNLNDGYSHYLKKADSIPMIEGVTTGIDFGENTNALGCEYVGSGTAQEVIIRTNSFNTNLVIDASSDTVNHYGAVGKVDVVAIDNECYNEHGSASYVKVAQGKVVVKAGGEIVVAYASTASAEVVVEGGAVEQNFPATANAEEVEAIANEAIQDAIVGEIIADTSNITAWIDMPLDDVVLQGSGIEADPYQIANALQLALVAKNINNNVDDGAYAGAYYKLTNNIDLAGKGWVPMGTGLYPFHGNFDGNGKRISNVEFDQKYIDISSWGQTDGAKNEGFAYGFFGVIGWQEGAHAGEKVTIANLTLDVSFETNGSTALGGLVGADAAAHKGSVVNSGLMCDIEVSDITINGKVIATNVTGSTVGGVVGKLYTQGNITIDGCTNNAEVKSESTDGESKLGGILGFFSGASNATITNNINNGNVSSILRGRNKAAGICLTGATSSSINISGNKNTGDITGSSFAVAAIAFSANDKPIYNQNHTVENNENSGTIYNYNSSTQETTEATHTYLVYGGKSQSPADNTTDDVKYEDGTPVLEINVMTK